VLGKLGDAEKGENLLMHRVISVYGRKIFSVALIFNALLTITCVAGLLRGVYADNWKPYTPFLIDGNVLWVIIALALVNVFPAAYFGKVHTGRLWFHHYVYGFFVLCASIVWVVFFTSVSIVSLFLVNTGNVAVNVGRFFILGGLALVLDDLPDVSSFSMRSLKWLKSKACQAGKVLHAAQIVIGIAALYALIAIVLSVFQNPNWVTPANFILIGSVLVTVLTSFLAVKLKTWLNLKLDEDSPSH
jgi:hypothetical protein